MLAPGKIVLLPFAYTDMTQSKLRPALALKLLPGRHQDWLICMISSKLHHAIDGIDETIKESSDDYPSSGLKAESLIRVTRLAVASVSAISGIIGTISPARMNLIRKRLSLWLATE